MSLWMIEPRDPVIFRDGKPFGNVPGARAKSLPFPFPSTVVGAVRTHSGPDANGEFSQPRVQELLGKQMRGPVLVSLTESGEIGGWLLPAPADSLLLKLKDDTDNKRGCRIWLRALEIPTGAHTNLAGLHAVGAPQIVKEKPHAKPPYYWHWTFMQAWLESPQNDPTPLELTLLGQNGPVRETRTHVSIEPGNQTAREGALFQTSGLEFIRALYSNEREKTGLESIQRLAMAVETDADLTETLSFMGGERRIVTWRESQSTLPTCPAPIRTAIHKDGHCRLVLATPAYFAGGYLPQKLSSLIEGVDVTVKAAAIQRYQTVSGWDYASTPGRPKPTRRLAPAGSVYFLQLDGQSTDIDSFIDTVWMQNVSDDKQARRDGFGLGLLGVWDGTLAQMEVDV